MSGSQSRNGVIPAFRLLAAGVPLSLLVDLADPNGPDSAAILRAEKPAHLHSHACRDRDGTPSSARAATG